MEEIKKGMVDDKIYVAVGKVVKESKSTLSWGLEELKKSGEKKICLVYVHQPAKFIPMPMGGRFPVSQVGELELKAFRERERVEWHRILDDYLQFCAQFGVCAEKVHIEADSVEKGIVELISQHRIQKLVMGAAADGRYSKSQSRRKMSKLKSKKANYVCQHAPDFCHIWFVCKSCLIYTREPVMQESSMFDDLYDKLQQFKKVADNWRQEDTEDSMSMEAEREAMEAILKVKAAAGYCDLAMRQGKECEEELEKGKEELQAAMNWRDNIAKELQEAFVQTKSLESQFERSNVAMKELEERILSSKELLQKYEEERNLIRAERDSALQEAVELRKQLGEGQSTSPDIPELFSEFSFFDIEKATNDFDPSLKIGHGGYGSVYRGFLRHTEVAIKTLKPNCIEGPQEFEREVNVLSKLQHQNVVTLVGTCPDAWALVYEYLNGGSLEDRLCCKDNSPPLQWHMRIRIASEICSALIFLHSSRPNSVIHGDLKPANILLDDNLVSKLSDFGICRVLLNDDVSAEQTTRSLCSEPKGTISYMDPEFLATGELTVKSDVYSFGVILLRLLTGRSALWIAKEVQNALDNGQFNQMLDQSAGDWPFAPAKELARIALRCCDMNRNNRPDLETEVWGILEVMKAWSGSFTTTLQLVSKHQVPCHFVCPILKQVMQDPHIAADGFTYEAEAIGDWFDSGHDTSPVTREAFENHHITPNRTLRSAILEWQQLQ